MLADASKIDGDGAVPFGFYLHVPFCSTRCGYCDFTTYTATDLGFGEHRASRESWADTAIAEVRLARRVLGSTERLVSTVFMGGGTPTLLPPAELGRVLAAIKQEFGLIAGAEVSTESNPDSIDAHGLYALRELGFNRVSFGMQSAVPAVLTVLDRQHTPGRPLAAVAEARAAGFEHVNLDLIYGTPGETDRDWQTSLDAVVAANPDHVSAYGLIVEDGTRLAAQVRRGELAAPDEDVMAGRYERADSTLSGAGYAWYEISNWARPGAHSWHNLAYWQGGDWWGVGPGAHSSFGNVAGGRGPGSGGGPGADGGPGAGGGPASASPGTGRPGPGTGTVRWWNVKHPAAWTTRLARGQSPALAREVLDEDAALLEQVMLGTRLASGLPVAVLDQVPSSEWLGGTSSARLAAQELVDEGLLSELDWRSGRAVPTLKGRLLADVLVRRLLGW